jgi:LPXTG-site transpeptidase (sortase) family protein
MSRDGDRFSPLLALIALVGVAAALAYLRPGAPEPARAGAAPAAPVRLVVPSLDLRAAVVPIEVETSGVLHPPADVDDVGWWRRSAEPGAAHGPTLLTGHTVSSGGGVMDRLGDLGRGDRVLVRTREGRVAYEATKVEVLSRAELAAQRRALFGRGGPARLVLVTCTGWDGHVYESNVVVTARPV